MTIGKHSQPPMDKCIRIHWFPFTLLSLLPSAMVLGLISLSRYVPWRALRGGNGCGYGDGGGCTQYGALAVATYGAKAGLAYIGRISDPCWHEHHDR